MKLKNFALKFIILLFITLAWSCQESYDTSSPELISQTRSTPCLFPIEGIIPAALAEDVNDYGSFENYDGHLDCLYQENYPPTTIQCPGGGVVTSEEKNFCCEKLADLAVDLTDITVTEIQQIVKKARKLAIKKAPACPDDGSDMHLSNMDFYIEYQPNPIIGGPPVPYVGFYAKYVCCTDGGGTE